MHGQGLQQIKKQKIQTLCERALFGIHPGLDAIQRALNELGDPQLRCPAIHISGSNGKGSVSAMMESIARKAGLKTGLYTSPQLCQFTDRIRINGENIDDQSFCDVLETALQCQGIGQPLTFFEVITIAAFLAFAQARVDIAILEVGLGGRWDATNVLQQPLACAITSIALEHTKILGSTTDQIAREKAGIFKKGAPFVLGPLDPAAEQAALEMAKQVSAGPSLRVRSPNADKINQIDHHFDGEILAGPLSQGRIYLETSGITNDRIETELSLKGPHQIQNAAVACGLSSLIALQIPAFRNAIAPGLQSAEWPGRFECIEHQGLRLIFDCAHNSHGMAALCATLIAEGIDPERTLIIFGALTDKDWKEMLGLIAPRASRRIYTRPRAMGRSAVPLSELAAQVPGRLCEKPAQALETALSIARPSDSILITGSIYLVAEMRALWLGIPCDPIIPL